jgi:hypothetical protein
MTKKIRTYSELMTIPSFEERYRYLKLDGEVGKDTFGFDRQLNQKLYSSPEWKRVRNHVIVRDCGRDLGVEGKELGNVVYIHHMNPISVDDIKNSTEYLLNPEYLITTCMDTHNAIHYGDEKLLDKTKVIKRTENDTSPWRNKKNGNN